MNHFPTADSTVYDFENEFQFQLQGYRCRAKGVNPWPHNRA
jgi:hypothetical protein